MVTLLRAGLAGLLGVISVSAAHAVTRDWPGAAPCDGTLQACIDGSGAGDTVVIVTDTPVDEAITIQNKALTLRGSGKQDATFAGFRALFVSSTDALNRAVNLEDLHFSNGGIQAVSSGSGTLTLRARRIVAFRDWQNPAISANASGDGGLDVLVENSDLSVQGDPDPMFPESMTAMSFYSTASKAPNYDIRFNRIRVVDSEQGEAIHAGSAGTAADVRIIGNRIDGENYNGGILVTHGAGSGQLQARVVGNVVRNQFGNVGASGALVIYASDGDVDALVYNNTLVDNRTALAVWGRADLGGEITGAVRGNLVAYNQSGILIDGEFDDPGIVANSHNLEFGNVYNEYTPGAGTVHLAPRLQPDGFRILDDSPAVDAGVNVSGDLGLAGIPNVDVDGQPRFNGVEFDIGAFETAGREQRTHQDDSANAADHVSIISWPRIDGDGTARTLFTPNYNPAGIGGVYNDHFTGIYYGAGQWRVFNQDFADMPQGAAFNLFYPDQSKVFTHTVSAGNQAGFTTVLDDARVNGKGGKVIIASPYWTSTYFDAPYSVAYLGPQWLIINEDGAAVPEFVRFFVYAQDPSQAGFRTFTEASAISGNTFYLDHPLLNGKACAQLQVTQGQGSEVLTTPFGVWFSNLRQRWAVFRQDLGTMPANVEFHVWFDPKQVEQCSSGELFRDGFEDVR
ncbi:MAG: choice-of-anchor Q domain-containing protein [Lysobacteraceae bacterium]